MCGILGFWARQSVPTLEQIDVLFRHAEKRGQDGVGVYVDGEIYRSMLPYHKCRDEVLAFVQEHLRLGSVLLGICRATPETEEPTHDRTYVQPVSFEDVVLVHNGGVADFILDDLGLRGKVKIDSEAIPVAYYRFHKNTKSMMEYLVGSFSVAMHDQGRNRLILISSFNPLAHGYRCGLGYVIASDVEAVQEFLGWNRTGVAVWEDYYFDVLPPYAIVETDLTSGFQTWHDYKPRFIFDGKDIETEPGKVKYLVSASGGVDSGLTAFLLKKAGYDVEMVHFRYGHRGQDAEHWAAERLAKEIGCGFRLISLENVYHQIGQIGMLLDSTRPITSGEELLKSTTAWVPGRNAVFMALLLSRAEALVLSERYDQVTVCGGWAQLSEETGGYPDNSFHFHRAVDYLRQVGYITGHHLSLANVLANLTKTEEWWLGYQLGFPFQYTVSCDNPRMDEKGPILCTECGSTRLSVWAAQRAGVPDPRRFYGPPVPPKALPPWRPDPKDLVVRLNLPDEARERILAELD